MYMYSQLVAQNGLVRAVAIHLIPRVIIHADHNMSVFNIKGLYKMLN